VGSSPVTAKENIEGLPLSSTAEKNLGPSCTARVSSNNALSSDQNINFPSLSSIEGCQKSSTIDAGCTVKGPGLLNMDNHEQEKFVGNNTVLSGNENTKADHDGCVKVVTHTSSSTSYMAKDATPALSNNHRYISNSKNNNSSSDNISPNSNSYLGQSCVDDKLVAPIERSLVEDLAKVHISNPQEFRSIHRVSNAQSGNNIASNKNDGSRDTSGYLETEKGNNFTRGRGRATGDGDGEDCDVLYHENGGGRRICCVEVRGLPPIKKSVDKESVNNNCTTAVDFRKVYSQSKGYKAINYTSRKSKSKTMPGPKENTVHSTRDAHAIAAFHKDTVDVDGVNFTYRSRKGDIVNGNRPEMYKYVLCERGRTTSRYEVVNRHNGRYNGAEIFGGRGDSSSCQNAPKLGIKISSRGGIVGGSGKVNSNVHRVLSRGRSMVRDRPFRSHLNYFKKENYRTFVDGEKGLPFKAFYLSNRHRSSPAKRTDRVRNMSLSRSPSLHKANVRSQKVEDSGFPRAETFIETTTHSPGRLESHSPYTIPARSKRKVERPLYVPRQKLAHLQCPRLLPPSSEEKTNECLPRGTRGAERRQMPYQEKDINISAGRHKTARFLTSDELQYYCARPPSRASLVFKKETAAVRQLSEYQHKKLLRLRLDDNRIACSNYEGKEYCCGQIHRELANLKNSLELNSYEGSESDAAVDCSYLNSNGGFTRSVERRTGRSRKAQKKMAGPDLFFSRTNLLNPSSKA
jgi:hypothetical protein